jgi:hypothetical protein
MEMTHRFERVVVGMVLVGLGSVGTGCAMPVDGGSPSKGGSSKGAEPVASTSSAQSITWGNVDCQSEAANVTIVTAQPLGQDTNHNPVYLGSVYTLLNSLCKSGAGCDANIWEFTNAYYGNIWGAAGYFYMTSAFPGSGDLSGSYWITIPIVDSQPGVTNPVGYYPSYPGLPAVRFPEFSWLSSTESLWNYAITNSWWPKTPAGPEGVWVGNNVAGAPNPYVLRDSDFNSLTSVMSLPASSDQEVMAQDATCVLIVDGHGAALDFTPHAAQWDPRPGCGGCIQMP